jgi:hypothetical protein
MDEGLYERFTSFVILAERVSELLASLWGRTAVANDVEAKFEVGLQELSNQARCVLSEPCTEFDFGYVEL